MDFLTTFPYWGIIVIILLNAWFVSRMDITFKDDENSAKGNSK